MQSDTPQGDPRLQRINPGPEIATGYVDPCIVYLETTLPGEIPALITCWAQASNEVKQPDGEIQLKLDNVVVIHWRPVTAFGLHAREMDFMWIQTSRREQQLILTSQGKDFSIQASARQPQAKSRFQGSIRFIDEKTNATFRDMMGNEWSASETLALKILRLANVDWPSIASALESQLPLNSRPRRQSFVGRVISTVFKKKPHPVHA